MAKKIEKKDKEKAKIKEFPKPKINKNVIVSYNKIGNDLKLELIKKYPDGYGNHIVRYPKPNGEYFFAVPLESKDMNYLIKVEVKIDNVITEDEFDKHFGDISEVDSKAIGDVDVDDSDDDDDDGADDQADETDDDDDDE
ncbi:MAG: hypothetical protein FWE63_00445 [Bacteroidales bacterium]|nr:hypothetical protein [Bacteroidales bacterium]